MDESYGSLRMMLNLSFRYDNKPWLGQAGSLQRPPVVVTTQTIGNIEDSLDEICKNWILWMKELWQFYKVVIKIYSGGCNKLQTNLSKVF